VSYEPAPDARYVEGHRFMYGDIGEHVATAAILFRDRLLRPGFVLPVVRIAPIAPYGKCVAQSGNSASLAHVRKHGLEHGVWLYLHHRLWQDGRFTDEVDEAVLHELVHNELMQFGEDPAHRSEAWARRCRELSDRLGIAVRIERPRSVRSDGKVTTVCPPGCLSYPELVRWPAKLLVGGLALRRRIEGAR
jgi:hypothetical protein